MVLAQSHRETTGCSPCIRASAAEHLVTTARGGEGIAAAVAPRRRPTLSSGIPPVAEPFLRGHRQLTGRGKECVCVYVRVYVCVWIAPTTTACTRGTRRQHGDSVGPPRGRQMSWPPLHPPSGTAALRLRRESGT